MSRRPRRNHAPAFKAKVALAAVAQRPAETAWIVTLSGKILRPREIQDMIGTLERD